MRQLVLGTSPDVSMLSLMVAVITVKVVGFQLLFLHPPSTECRIHDGVSQDP